MFPNRCSILKNGKQCFNPPEFIVTITTIPEDKSKRADEYMFGVTCNTHKKDILVEVRKLQEKNMVTSGTIGFTPLKPVGTDCIKGDASDLVHIDQ